MNDHDPILTGIAQKSPRKGSLRFAVWPTALFLMLLMCPPVQALDMEYITYGGYTAVVAAFQKAALVFSDSSYPMLFYVSTALGLFLAGASAYFSLLRGVKTFPLAWVWPVGLGVVLYFGLVLPKGSLMVYDPVMNRQQRVTGLPDGVVFIAGTLNRIESGLVDIISDAGDVSGYQNSAGGMGLNALYAVTKGGYGLGGSHIDASVKNYVKDCVLFEMARPGTSLTAEAITRSTTDLRNEFAEASNPAIFTTTYDDSSPEGRTMSCQAAWTGINAVISNPTALEGIVRNLCSDAGFNSGNAAELQRCKDMIGDYATYLYGGLITTSFDALTRQAGMAEALDHVLKQENPDLALKAASNRGIMQSGMGMALVANEWLPVLRAVFTAIAVGLVPFIVLFLPTGVGPRAVSLTAGFFIWLTSWGVTDAMLHGIASDYAWQALAYIRDNNLGYNAIMLFPSYIEKALAVFGLAKTAGIMLATVMTAMLISFGGYALAALAGNITGTIQAAGSQTSPMDSSALAGEPVKSDGWRDAVGSWENPYKSELRRGGWGPSAAGSAESRNHEAGAAAMAAAGDIKRDETGRRFASEYHQSGSLDSARISTSLPTAAVFEADKDPEIVLSAAADSHQAGAPSLPAEASAEPKAASGATLQPRVRRRRLPAGPEDGEEYDDLVRETVTLYPVGRGSELFESRGNAGAVSTGKNDSQGGVSYGRFQFPRKYVDDFLRAKGWSDLFAGLKPGSPEFSVRWKEVAAEYPEEFAGDQYEYVRENHYRRARDSAEAEGFDIEDRGIQEALFSMGVQHWGSPIIIGNAAGELRQAHGSVEHASPRQQIKALFESRTLYYPPDRVRYDEEARFCIDISEYDRSVSSSGQNEASSGNDPAVKSQSRGADGPAETSTDHQQDSPSVRDPVKEKKTSL